MAQSRNVPRENGLEILKPSMAVRAYAQCDVVNGGDDQRCYLLFPPKDKEAAQQALDAYQRRLYPFTQREAKFREEVGPPPVVHLSKRVIANLDFIKNCHLMIQRERRSRTLKQRVKMRIRRRRDRPSHPCRRRLVLPLRANLFASVIETLIKRTQNH